MRPLTRPDRFHSGAVRQGVGPWLLWALPFPVMFAALMVGRYAVPAGDVWLVLTHALHKGLVDLVRTVAEGLGLPELLAPVPPLVGVSPPVQNLVLLVRVPRVVSAALVGANLAVAGAAYQGVFRNPLVEGRLLGVSSGAALGAAVAFLLFPRPEVVQTLAFLGGVGGVALTSLLGWAFGGSVLILVIAGVLVDSFLSAAVGIVKYVADPLGTLPAITYWLLGGLSGVRMPQLVPLALASGMGLLALLAIRWHVNVLTLGEAEGESLGVRVRTARMGVVGLGTLLVASAVSVGGTISWVGLLVPHAARALVGPDYARLIPASMGLGAALVVVLDTVARTALTAEIPLGILTGLLGAPLFLALFLRFLKERGGWR